jgi:pimeloyl-ACP methyl ester carboxylesterase
MIMRWKSTLLAALLLFAGEAGAADCGNFWGARCKARLSTGVEMTYVEIGPKSGPPLIFLHGYTDSALEWVDAVRALAKLDPGLHLLALDQRGAGGTGLPETPLCAKTPGASTTNDDHIADVAAFIAALKLKQPVVVGHSMGSYVARGLAVAHPDLIKSIILVGTGFPLPGGPIGMAGLPGAPRVAGGEGPLSPAAWRKTAEARGLKWPEEAFDLRPLDLDPQAVEAMEKYWDVSALASAEFSAAISAQTALVPLKYWGIDPVEQSGEPEHLADLKVPVMVLWGSQDGTMTRASQEALIATLKTSHAKWVWKQYGARALAASGAQTDDLGHEIVWEAPNELALDIAAYLKTGLPTADSYHAEAGKIVTEPGKAIVVKGP